ncbi:hypothetical protein GCM10010193_17910 [Kitasatospora atroaurantiaca]
MREIAPGNAGAVDVQDRVEQVTQVVLGGRPKARARWVRAWRQAVRVGSTKAQRASDRSLGYGRRSVMMSAYR